MSRRFIEVDGARQSNLKGVSVRVPIGAVTAVTGVAGAGHPVAVQAGSPIDSMKHLVVGRWPSPRSPPPRSAPPPVDPS